MKKICLYSLVVFVMLSFIQPSTGNAWRLKGKYKGKSTAITTGCEDPADNRKVKGIRTKLFILNQTKNTFDGTIINRKRVGGDTNIEDCLIITGVKKRRGRLKGESLCNFYVNGDFDSSSSGTFKGRKYKRTTGPKLVIKTISESDIIGDTCITEGTAKLN
jgi:hypothetical protein